MAFAAINANPAAFTDLALNLFFKKGWLSGAVHRNHIGRFTLQLFPQVWDAVSSKQRALLAEKLCSSELLQDEAVYTGNDGKRVYYSRYGRDTLKYLQALGPERLLDFPKLRKLYSEFVNRWGEISHDESGRRSKVTWGYPTPTERWQVEKLNPSNWLSALRKYRAKERFIFSDRGTYTGLCHSINDLIKANPASWVVTLEYLIENEDESVAILLPALSEANATAAAPLVEYAYQKQLIIDDAYRRLKRNVRKELEEPEQEIKPEYVKHDLAEVMANLTAESTINFGDKNPKRDLLTAAINTPGASELNELMREKLPEALVPEVVAVLKEVARKGALPVRTAAVERLAMLLRTTLPNAEVSRLFVELVGTDFVLLAAGQWSLNHLTWRDPILMIALMERALAEPLAHESITRVLTVQWGHDTARAHSLLERIWQLNPAMKAVTLDQLNTGYAAWKNRQIFFDAFQDFLGSELDKDLLHEFDDTFRDFPPDDFLLILPFLPEYIRACVPRSEYNHFFLDFLAKCVKQYPAECIRLVNLFFQELNNSHPRYPYSRIALKILIEAYTRLPHQNAQNTDVQSALDLFDLLLSRTDVRSELSQVMQEVGAY